MAQNATVLRFKALTEELRQEVHDLAVSELNAQADALIDTMKQVAPNGPTGDLDISIKKVPDAESDTIVRVVAGGPLTTEASPTGLPYDYSRAVEFGTIHMAAQPFFFPTYRLMIRKMRSTMKRKITASIKKRSAE